MAGNLNIKVIIGSTRQGRFSDKPAHWIFETLKKREGIDAELLDLRDYPMPFFDEPVSPSMIKEPYANEVVQKWTAKVKEADGFIICTAEYNHAMPAVLKNALDYVYKEWNKKAVAFVSWGSAGGARAIQQLRPVMIELQMAPIRNSVHIPGDIYMKVMNEKVPPTPELFGPLNERAEGLIDQLTWWAKALKTAREQN